MLKKPICMSRISEQGNFESMPRIAIVYFSNTDVTEQLAKAIASGASQESGITVFEHKIDGQ